MPPAAQGRRTRFLYMLRKEASDAVSYLTLPTGTEERQWLMDSERNLWAAALLELCVSGHLMDGEASVAGFSPVDVSVSASGVVTYGRQPGSRQLMRFEIQDKANFAKVCTKRTAELLARLPMIRP